MREADNRAGADVPGAVELRTPEQQQGDYRYAGGERVDDRGSAQLPGDARHEGEGGRVDAVEHYRGPGRAAQAVSDLREQADEDERRSEDRHRRDQGPERPRHEI